MDKAVLKLIVTAFLNSLEAYAKSTETDIDDKAIALIKSTLKYFGLV